VSKKTLQKQRSCPSLQAQMSKLDAIIDAADLQQGHRVLEIGCGWGSFALRAAQRTGASAARPPLPS